MRKLSVALLLLLLTACVSPPRPVPERSPLALPERNRRYMPIVIVDRLSLGKGAATTWTNVYDGCQDARAVGAAWLYDWSPQPPPCDGILSVPMQWGRFDVKSCPALGPGRLAFGFNEPDRPDQANITPERAAELWHRLTVECYPERLWATPAVYLSATYDGLPWLSAWWNSYVTLYGQAPRADYLAVHCFTWTSANACVSRLTAALAWAQAHGGPDVLVSEWAVLPGAIGEAAALREAATLRAWLDAQPAIVGYAWTSTRIEGGEAWWFGRQNNTGLVDFATGQLTAWGAWYAK